MKPSFKLFRLQNTLLTIPRPVIVIGLLVITAILLILLLPLLVELTEKPRMGRDYYIAFKPALAHLYAGFSPYDEPTFFSPPWTLAFYAPFTLIPEPYDLIVLWVVHFAVFAVAAHKMGAAPVVAGLFLTSPQVVYGAILGNNDWMVALGLVVPSWLGLLLVMVKPQVGAPIAVFILAEAWRRGGWREVTLTSAPMLILSVISLLIWGEDLLQGAGAVSVGWNIAPFPHLLPIGLVLLYSAVQKRKLELALLTGPMIAPYMGVQSLSVYALGLLSSTREALLAIIALWVAWFLR